jgi:hypothetical protein
VSLVDIFEVLAMHGAGVGSICWVDDARGQIGSVDARPSAGAGVL